MLLVVSLPFPTRLPSAFDSRPRYRDTHCACTWVSCCSHSTCVSLHLCFVVFIIFPLGLFRDTHCAFTWDSCASFLAHSPIRPFHYYVQLSFELPSFTIKSHLWTLKNSQPVVCFLFFSKFTFDFIFSHDSNFFPRYVE
jgi:hypothetical protein